MSSVVGTAGMASVPGARRRDLGAPAPIDITDEDSLLPRAAAVSGTLRRMLLSALVLFAETGYHGVPVREIARGAGMRASSMYEHRASKEQLLLDLMLIGHRQHRQALLDALVAAPQDPAAQLVAYVRAHVSFHAAYPMLARVCNRELSALSPDSLDQVLSVRRASEGLSTEIIARGIQEGAFSVPDPWLATAAIGGMGIRVAEWYRPDSAFKVEEVADAYALFALRLAGSGIRSL